MSKRFIIFFLVLFVFLGGICATETLIPSVDNDSVYVKTKLVNGGFDAKPSMENGVNGIGKGWNTTESVGFEWMEGNTNIHNSTVLRATNWVEMNNNNACSYWQDLYTTGGDVIKWSLKHAARSGFSVDTQSINVSIGNPVRDNNNNPVAATGNGNTVTNNIQTTGLAVYTGSGITAGSGTVAFANSGDISGLSATTYTQWYYANGIYIVPSDQTITRFAFQSMIDGGIGNILDEADVVTLIGNLTAALQRDGSLKLYGFWGETSTSKKMVVTLGTKSWQINMSSVCDKNFVITIPKADVPENATTIKVYHEDYSCAERTIDIVPGYNILMYVGQNNKTAIQSKYNMGEAVEVIRKEYQATTSISSGKVKINAHYTEDQNCLINGTDLINEYSLVFICCSDDFGLNTQTVADNLITYTKQGGCLVMIGETAGFEGSYQWYYGNEVLSTLADEMGIDIKYGEDIKINGNAVSGNYIQVNTNTDLTNVEGSKVNTLFAHYIPRLVLGKGTNTLKNTTKIGTINDEPVITDTKVNNGYITFLTDINMWMGGSSNWKTNPSWPEDSRNFMKNLLRRSVNNIEAVSKMNKITYIGLEGSHYASDGGKNTLTNPSSYSSTVTFTLNNPIKDDYVFVGWSGTGISGLSKTVTVAIGSTGDRTYTANWHKHEWVYSAKGSSLFAYCNANDINSHLCSYHDAEHAVSLFLQANGNAELYSTIQPSNATNKNVIWSSSNTGILTVDQKGFIRGVKAGTATLTATSTDGTNKTSTCSVTVQGK